MYQKKWPRRALAFYEASLSERSEAAADEKVCAGQTVRPKKIRSNPSHWIPRLERSSPTIWFKNYNRPLGFMLSFWTCQIDNFQLSIWPILCRQELDDMGQTPISGEEHRRLGGVNNEPTGHGDILAKVIVNIWPKWWDPIRKHRGIRLELWNIKWDEIRGRDC